MKIERAMEILDPEHRECYESMEEVNEACRMGMEALEYMKRREELLPKRPQYEGLLDRLRVQSMRGAQPVSGALAMQAFDAILDLVQLI